ncbi:hypothetical protein BRARA_E03517 [Brassica rapa]|uniref:Uncharacterized protein n=1 Tax=Brassica campestris TaxID=3711 RepID=A0A397ZGI2_BRACM|nr:hypothetical protein BRARA_E03517 [Brassica rapa]
MSLLLICGCVVYSVELICSLPPVGDFTLISKKEVKCEAVEGKVVWITGANRGIGEALAKQFASLGAKLILSARNEAELFRIKSELKGKYAPEHVKKSNAVDASEENLETTFGVNVFGTISLTKLVTPHMLKRGGGHFVVISSAAGKVPSPGQAIYAASKHALQGYFHTLRSEKRVSSERCAELTIIAASHNLKEAWISHQPELLVMYLVQYMPSLGLWLMDKKWNGLQVGGKRVEVAEKKVS